jgi:transcription-repair coupling factor (superfamily II helicase)
MALKLAEAAQLLDAPLLIIASNARELSRLEDELRVFLPSTLELLSIPGWETLPYDLFAPHPDIISQRLSTLSRLPHLRQGVVLVDVDTVLQRLAPRSYIDAHAFDIAVGNKLDLKTFRLKLAAAGYAHTSQVMAPGELYCAVHCWICSRWAVTCPIASICSMTKWKPAQLRCGYAAHARQG